MAEHSINRYTGDGVTTQYAISFTGGYTNQSDISCWVNRETDGVGDPLYRTLTFINEGLVVIGGAIPGVGEEIIIRRTTDIDEPVNDFVGGTILDDDALDNGFKQAMRGIQEALDNAEATTAADASATAAAASATAADADAVSTAADRVVVTAAAAQVAVDAVSAGNSATAAAASAAAAEQSAIDAAAGGMLGSNNLSDVADPGASRTNLGVVIGSDVQAYSLVLTNTTASFTTTLKTKLDGIASGAQVNPTNAEIAASYNTQVGQVTQAEAEAGTVTGDRRWSPKRVKQAIAAQAGSGGLLVKRTRASLTSGSGTRASVSYTAASAGNRLKFSIVGEVYEKEVPTSSGSSTGEMELRKNGADQGNMFRGETSKGSGSVNTRSSTIFQLDIAAGSTSATTWSLVYSGDRDLLVVGTAYLLIEEFSE